jgi:hypothetical protein
MILKVLHKLIESLWMFAVANTAGTAVRRSYRFVHHQVSQLSQAAVSIMSPSSQNNKEQMTAGARVKISYHQTRGCYVQRSKYGFCPGGRLRSLL